MEVFHAFRYISGKEMCSSNSLAASAECRLGVPAWWRNCQRPLPIFALASPYLSYGSVFIYAIFCFLETPSLLVKSTSLLRQEASPQQSPALCQPAGQHTTMCGCPIEPTRSTSIWGTPQHPAFSG